ncbi:ABC-type transporter Mla subunit MlaD [Salinibacter ruber]|uniref:hypothetical protein n=1 Tax=Salinibacter ruber TaxID=146919 RepID=UPI00216938ED|nr:hypothetical protein [Salinibacter ruber]MCS3827447.1 ABC-type transporter Mla subunit MlaD [Salinibacter ruber]
MPSETLTYRFEEENLDSLRSDMEALASDTEDVGESAQDTASDLEDMGSDGTDVAGDITSDMEDAEGAIGELGDEAQQTAGQMEEEFQVASDEVRSQIEKMSDRLTQFNEQGVSLGGISGQAASAGGGGSLAQGLGIGALLGSGGGSGQTPEAVKELVQTAPKARREVRNLVGTLKQLESAKARAASSGNFDDLRQTIEDVEQNLADSVDEAYRLGASADALDQDLDEAGRSVADLREKMADTTQEGKDTEQQMEDLGGSLGELAESTGLGGVISQLGEVSGKAMAAARAFGPVRGSILALTAAVGTLAPKMGQLARELQSAAANASRLPSEIQKVANAQELLTGRRDAEEVGEIFKEFNLRMREAQEGSQEAQEGFQRLGITMEQLGEMTPNEAFGLVIERLRKASKEQEALSREQVLGGQAAERFALMTSLSADELERLNRVANETSFADEQVSRFAAMGRELDSIGQRLRKLGGELLGIFEPVISTVLKLFDQLLRGITYVFDKIEDYVREMWGMLQDLDSEWFGTERRLEFNFQGGDGTDSKVPDVGSESKKSPRQRMSKTLNSQAKRIARIRQRAEKGLISEKEMLRQIISARESAFQELQKLGQEAPSLFTDKLMNHLVSEIKRLQERLEQATQDKTEVPGHDVSDAPAGADPASTASLPGPSGDIDGEGLAADMQQRAANMRRAYEEELSNIEQMAGAVGDNIGRLLSRSIQSALQGLGSGLGSALSKAFGGNERQVTQLKMTRRRLQQEERSLRESLRKREISHQMFALRRKALNQRLAKNSKKMGEATESAWKDAFESLATFVGDIIKQVISKLVTAITTALALKAIMMAIPGMQAGSVGTLFTSAMSGGGFGSIETNAEGGVYSGPTLGMVGEYPGASSNKEIISPENKMRSVFAETMADMGGMGGHMTVQVQGETTTDGRDLKTSYDQTTRIQRRKGRRE